VVFKKANAVSFLDRRNIKAAVDAPRCVGPSGPDVSDARRGIFGIRDGVNWAIRRFYC
jgi:hypothetical protein